MKKILWISTFFIISIVSIYYYYLVRREYIEKVSFINKIYPLYPPLFIYDDYFFDNHSLPKNQAEIDRFASERKESRYQFKDAFSKSDDNLLYIPLYSRKDNLYEGYLVISSGVDGKINTIVEDTVFIDEILRFNLYNPYPIKTTNKGIAIEETFSIIDYLFGKKDLVLEYINCVESYKDGAKGMGTFSPVEFYNKFEKRIKRNNLAYMCAIKGKVKDVKDSSVTISDSNIQVHFNLSKFNTISAVNNNDITVAARYVSIVDSIKTLYFKDAIILESKLK